MSDKRNLIIKNGIYRIECISYEVTNVNFELSVYYDETNELIAQRWVHGSVPPIVKNDPSEWRLYTKENDIVVRYSIGSRSVHTPLGSSVREIMFGNRLYPRIVDHIDLSVDVCSPDSFNRSLILTFTEVQMITEKYCGYDVINRQKWELNRDHAEIERVLESLRITHQISPMVVSHTVIDDLIERLNQTKCMIEDRVYTIISEQECRIRNIRNRFIEDGVNPAIIYSDASVVEIFDHSSASYIRWKQHGCRGISAIKLG